MASVYILYSKKLNRFYIGSCNDLSYRIDQHLTKSFIKSFTAKSDDWEIFLSIDDLEYQQARSVELHIKKMKSKIYIENLKKYLAIAKKLIEKYE
jgi:putative endonuclease